MRFPDLPTRTGLAAAAFLTLAVACNDSPSEPAIGGDNVAYSQADQDPLKTKKGDVQFVRVRGGDGAMVGGTALSSERLGAGSYALRFEPPISDCAATANSAAFPGFDGSVFRVDIQISIGFGDGGVPDDGAVRVRTFDSLTGASLDTSFALILACP